jgi:Fe-S cluster biogenesis protein NfuA
VSWLDRVLGSERKPASPLRGDPARVDEVQRVLDELAPLIAADGGRVELAAVDGGVVRVRLQGACTHCGSSDMTLQGAIEPRLRAALPWFEGLRVE